MPELPIKKKIESILLFKNEPLNLKELAKLLSTDTENINKAVTELERDYENRGVVIVNDGETVTLGTSPDCSELIEKIQKEELERDIGRAGLETLSIVLYKGPVSRREIDFIRGVNSGFILRNLLVRGLIERTESLVGERSYSYKPTLELLRFLGIRRREDLPEFGIALKKIETFVEEQPKDANE